MQTGKLVATAYGLTVPFVLLFILFSIVAGHANLKGVWKTLPILMVSPISGFLAGIFMAVMYNIAAKCVGGIEVSIEPNNETAHSPSSGAGWSSPPC